MLLGGPDVASEVQRLSSQDPAARRSAVLALLVATGNGAHCCLPIPDERVREWEDARRQLRKLGPVAAPALVPVLIERRRALPPNEGGVLLAIVGAAAVEHVTPLMRHRDAHVRTSAAWTLCEIGAAASPAIPALIPALDDPDPWVRHGAAWALHATEARTPEVVAALRAALRNDVAIVRVDAAAALLARNLHRDEALEVFWNAWEENARIQMLLQLPRVLPDHPRTIPTLVAALGDADVSDCAADGLRRLMPGARLRLVRLLATVPKPVAERLRALLREDC